MRRGKQGDDGWSTVERDPGAPGATNQLKVLKQLLSQAEYWGVIHHLDPMHFPTPNMNTQPPDVVLDMFQKQKVSPESTVHALPIVTQCATPHVASRQVRCIHNPVRCLLRQKPGCAVARLQHAGWVLHCQGTEEQVPAGRVLSAARLAPPIRGRGQRLQGPEQQGARAGHTAPWLVLPACRRSVGWGTSATRR